MRRLKTLHLSRKWLKLHFWKAIKTSSIIYNMMCVCVCVHTCIVLCWGHQRDKRIKIRLRCSRWQVGAPGRFIANWHCALQTSSSFPPLYTPLFSINLLLLCPLCILVFHCWLLFYNGKVYLEFYVSRSEFGVYKNTTVHRHMSLRIKQPVPSSKFLHLGRVVQCPYYEQPSVASCIVSKFRLKVEARTRHSCHQVVGLHFVTKYCWQGLQITTVDQGEPASFQSLWNPERVIMAEGLACPSYPPKQRVKSNVYGYYGSELKKTTGR